MASRFRARLLTAGLAATLCAGGLLSSAAGASAKEPEGGVFPGEEGRLPGGEERKALGLIFREADLFFARPPCVGSGGVSTPPGKTEAGVESKASPGAGSAVRVYLALKNPKNFSSKKTAEGAPRPPMDFLGWGLTAVRGEILSAAGFGPSGRFRGGAASPRGGCPPG